MWRTISIAVLAAALTTSFAPRARADEHGGWHHGGGDRDGGAYRGGEQRGGGYRGFSARPLPLPARGFGLWRRPWLPRPRFVAPAPACGYYDAYGRWMPYRYNAYGNLVACNPYPGY